jgi:hypothetical protein
MQIDWCAGGLAQLVERYFCKVDVSGSNPLSSTDPDDYLQIWVMSPLHPQAARQTRMVFGSICCREDTPHSPHR